MSDFQTTVREIIIYVKIRTPLIVLHSRERDRAESVVQTVSDKTGLAVEMYKSAVDFSCLTDDINKKKNAMFALFETDGFEKDRTSVKSAVKAVRLAADRGCVLVFVTDEPVCEELSRLGVFVKLGLPSKKEREAMIRDFMAEEQIRTLPPEKISQSAVILGGYTAMQLNTVMKYTLNTDDGFTYENLCKTAMEKDKIFGRNPAVRRIKVRGVQMAGMDAVKEWLLKKQKIFFSPDEELAAKFLHPPKGALMVGVPGCGKSLTARLISCEWHLPLYRFDIGAVFSASAGESETNLRRALDYIGSVSPCIVWIDEIEKELAAGHDNEAAQRILGAVLFWLQENAERVFLIATANDVTKLPPELFRKGRFDEVFFVDLPNEAERKSAINLFAKLSLTVRLTEEEVDALAKISEGFSYADIEWAIKTVAEEEYTLGMCGSYTRLDSVFQRTVGILSRNREYIESLRKWGEECATPASGRK